MNCLSIKHELFCTESRLWVVHATMTAVAAPAECSLCNDRKRRAVERGWINGEYTAQTARKRKYLAGLVGRACILSFLPPCIHSFAHLRIHSLTTTGKHISRSNCEFLLEKNETQRIFSMLYLSWTWRLTSFSIKR